jgi:predicted unusual protein kinase regulating ubiquinone biosynthesis (AarF/ABC1/UbiB family)
MKNLYVESRLEEQRIRERMRKYKEDIIVNLIDVGMVIELNVRDKKNFVNFIKSIIEGKGELCAEMIYNLSNFGGKKIITGKFDDFYNQLKDCFSIINN